VSSNQKEDPSPSCLHTHPPCLLSPPPPFPIHPHPQVEIKELSRVKEDLDRLKFEIIEERRKELAPMVEAVTAEIKIVKESVDAERERLEQAAGEAMRVRDQWGGAAEELETLEESEYMSCCCLFSPCFCPDAPSPLL
jgi:hypothetical protein